MPYNLTSTSWFKVENEKFDKKHQNNKLYLQLLISRSNSQAIMLI